MPVRYQAALRPENTAISLFNGCATTVIVFTQGVEDELVLENLQDVFQFLA